MGAVWFPYQKIRVGICCKTSAASKFREQYPCYGDWNSYTNIKWIKKIHCTVKSSQSEETDMQQHSSVVCCHGNSGLLDVALVGVASGYGVFFLSRCHSPPPATRVSCQRTSQLLLADYQTDLQVKIANISNQPLASGGYSRLQCQFSTTCGGLGYCACVHNHLPTSHSALQGHCYLHIDHTNQKNLPSHSNLMRGNNQINYIESQSLEVTFKNINNLWWSNFKECEMIRVPSWGMINA